MSDIKLFKLEGEKVSLLEEQSMEVEKGLQRLIERHMPRLIGVTFLASEYGTGKTHGGRIDSLGIDENGCPVIIEYKRSINENVINQGLFYLDWLLDHKAEFELLVQKKIGPKKAEEIEWSQPRLLCIAGDFTKYDEYAVQQINRNIELIRYIKYGDDILLLQLVNSSIAFVPEQKVKKGKGQDKTVSEDLDEADESLRDLFESLKDFIFSLGDDIQLNVLKHYFAFRRISNFACVEFRPRNHAILIYLKVDPTTIELEPGFTRDMREIGHYGTGDLEIILHNKKDLEKVKPFIVKSYESN
ncbi:MAG: DUF91 domain-containing protein [Methanomassiliicoccales archaeon]|nr:MAG: DUF91 domain-containing protein [Methanomassiliicoccales archaeon]